MSPCLGKKRGPLWSNLRRPPAKVSLFQLLSMPLPEGSPENSLSALFMAGKVRLSVALAGLRDLDHWSSAQDLHRESKEEWEMPALSLIENQGLLELEETFTVHGCSHPAPPWMRNGAQQWSHSSRSRVLAAQSQKVWVNWALNLPSLDAGQCLASAGPGSLALPCSTSIP